MSASGELENAHRIIVYGGRLIALETVLRLRRFYPKKLWGCVVSSMDGNPAYMGGYPVCALSECEERIGEGWQENSCVVLALGASYYEDVYKTLNGIGVKSSVTFEDLNEDEKLLTDWTKRITSCKRMVLLGDKEHIHNSQAYLGYVWPELTVECVSEDEIQPNDLVVMAMDVPHCKYWITLSGRLCNRGCSNIMDIKYMYDFIQCARGGDRFLRSLLWDRRRWREQAKAVINKSRRHISSSSVAHDE